MIDIFTVGHSNNDWPSFLRLLEIANIGVVADVRSYPSSAFGSSTVLNARLADGASLMCTFPNLIQAAQDEIASE